MGRLAPDTVVVLPTGEAWLRQQLQHPNAAYHRVTDELDVTARTTR